MKKIVHFTFAAFIVICNLKAYSQDIITDNKGKPIFNMPTSLIAPKITANSGGVRFPIKR
ncbi:hypothetical protein ACFQ3S_17945 [Mucilaginibacter terrae]|uniref:hypothetical protein n=1 Tax=Mucilaginibacter terrae TaxID=1955052 RepID=UPI003645F635